MLLKYDIFQIYVSYEVVKLLFSINNHHTLKTSLKFIRKMRNFSEKKSGLHYTMHGKNKK